MASQTREPVFKGKPSDLYVAPDRALGKLFRHYPSAVLTSQSLMQGLDRFYKHWWDVG
jgi:hypothetical protein